jgi:hypothetical protein
MTTASQQGVRQLDFNESEEPPNVKKVELLLQAKKLLSDGATHEDVIDALLEAKENGATHFDIRDVLCNSHDVFLLRCARNKIDPKTSSHLYHLLIAQAYMKKQDCQRAVGLLDVCLSKKGDCVPALKLRAQALLTMSSSFTTVALKVTARARKDLRKARQIDPLDVEINQLIDTISAGDDPAMQEGSDEDVENGQNSDSDDGDSDDSDVEVSFGTHSGNCLIIAGASSLLTLHAPSFSGFAQVRSTDDRDPEAQ